MRSNMAWAFWFLGLSSLVACVLPPPQPISGTVVGNVNAVALTNHADSGTYTATSSNGTFSFTTAVSQYDVTAVTTDQNCSVKNGVGQVGGSPVTNIAVTCSGSNNVAVNVTGMAGSGNLLVTNGQDALAPITANGTYVFAGTVNPGAAYNVSVSGNPNNQTCTATNGSGSVNGNVVVPVNCTTTASYILKGYVNNLLSSITIQNSNNMETVTVINPNTSFQFPTPLEPNEHYSLVILTQPVDQTCDFVNASGSGTTGIGNTSSIAIACTAALRTVSVTVSGLSGAVQVINNGTDVMNITQNGAYTFATALHDNSVFNVTVGSQPKNQACVIPNPYGQVNGVDIYAINVNCVSPSNLFPVGGVATGLQGSVTLNNLGIESIVVNQDGAFTFPTHMTTGSAYNVYITGQPPGQSCAITTVQGNEISGTGAGQVSTGPVNSLRLNCNVGYSVGGTVTNLTGNTLRLLNTINGTPTEILSVAAGKTSYQFTTPLPTNATYDVQVLSQPAGEVCSVANPLGATTTANIVNANVACVSGTSHNYTVGGTVTGLSGGTLVLSNDGFDPVSITSSGGFTFPTALASTAPYEVTITSQPAGQICNVQDGTNTVTGANVTSVQVICQAAYTISVPITGLSGGNIVLQAFPYEPTVVVSSNGTYNFPQAVPGNQGITIFVASSPDHQQCVAAAASGYLPGNLQTQIICGPFWDFIRGQSAVSVVGQTGFYTDACNGTSEGTVTSNSVCYPVGDSWISSTSQVYLPDFGNNRVLLYNNVPMVSGSNANIVLGQTGFSANGTGVSATALNAPMGVGGTTGKVAVADAANSRVLIYSTPVTSGASAAVVVGQAGMTTNASGCSATGLNAPQSAVIVNNSLYVTDTGNNRVLIYTPVPTASGASATTVVGQSSMTSCTAPSLFSLNGSVLNAPQDLWTDGTRLIIADTQDNRVLIFSAMPSNGGAADGVLGQSNMSNYTTSASSNGMSYPTSIASNGEQLFVVDSLNNRVLVFDALPLYWRILPAQSGATGPAADVVLGQVDFNYAYVNSLSGVTGPETLHKPSGIALNGNVLIVTDTGNNRFTIYNGF